MTKKFYSVSPACPLNSEFVVLTDSKCPALGNFYAVVARFDNMDDADARATKLNGITVSDKQRDTLLHFAIIEHGLDATALNAHLLRHDSLNTIMHGLSVDDMVLVAEAEYAEFNQQMHNDFTHNNDGIGVITNDVALLIQKELGIDEAKTGVRLSQDELESRWGLKISPQLESTESSNIEKAKIALNVVGFAVALLARKKMADKGMVRSFWYGFPHKPGTFPKNK